MNDCQFPSFLWLSISLGLCFLDWQPRRLLALHIPQSIAQESFSGERQTEADRLLQQGHRQFRQSQFREAIETYQQVLELYRFSEDRLGEAEALYHLGVTYRMLARYPQAQEQLDRGLAIAEEISARLLMGQLLSEMGVVRDRRNEYPQALELYQQAIAIARERGNSTETQFTQRQTEVHTLDRIGDTYRKQGLYDRALELHQQALEISREIGDLPIQARILNNIGIVYSLIGESDRALEFDRQALDISRETGDRFLESRILSSMGTVFVNLGEYDRAFEFYREALQISRSIEDRLGEGEIILSIGILYSQQGEYLLSIEDSERALEIFREIRNRTGEGNSFIHIGLAYQNLGEFDRSLTFYQQALEIYKDVGDRWGEGNVLSSLGGTYYSQGQYFQALELYQQAQTIYREIGNPTGLGATLNNLGGIYYTLGQFDEALEFYNQALEIRQEIGDRPGVATTLTNIGLVYDVRGQSTEALEFYHQALEIRQDIGDRPGVAATLHNIGLVYDFQGQSTEALEFYNQALEIRQEIGDRAGAANTLGNIGIVYSYLAQYPQAIEAYQQALGIFRDIGDRAGEGLTLSVLGELLAGQNQSELAIVFYKKAVNVYESIRQELQGLSPELQESYTGTVADTYRNLADLLLQQDRILEAQQVLDLLKVQELDDYLRGVRGNDRTVDGIDNLPPERQIWENYSQKLDRAIALGKELSELRLISLEERTEVQNQRIAELVEIQQDILGAFYRFIESEEVTAQLDRLRDTTSENLELTHLNQSRDNLRDLQQNAVLLYPLILDDRLELVLVTPDSPPLHKSVWVTREELNQAILDFRQDLVNPYKLREVQQSAQQLYTWLVEPIESALAEANAETLIYAPDGQLRYIPLAALHDGNGWLVERFRINHITAASLTELNSQPQPELKILAGAFANGFYSFEVGENQFNFGGLPYAGLEVQTLAETVPNTTEFIDTEFSPDATVPLMDDHTVVHLATHAAFVTGQPEDSFILFGNGDRVTLQDVKRYWNFLNVDLVVLSACQTGLGGFNNGEEILGFGYLMQQAGARAAIASLWIVDDGGTKVLMNAFYGGLQQNLTKAEALRQAQMALITGDDSAVGDARGDAIELVFAESLPPQVRQGLSHPYYWAPFILIGNGL